MTTSTPSAILHEALAQGRSVEDAKLAILCDYPAMTEAEFYDFLDTDAARFVRMGQDAHGETDELELLADLRQRRGGALSSDDA